MKVYYVKMNSGYIDAELMFSSYSALLQHFSENDLSEYSVEIKPFDLIDTVHQDDVKVMTFRKDAEERINNAIKQHFENPNFT